MKLYKSAREYSFLKKLCVYILLIIPAFFITFLFLLMLVLVDYKQDPSSSIGLLLWASWSLLCSFIFGSRRLLYAGICLLLFSLLNLFGK